MRAQPEHALFWREGDPSSSESRQFANFSCRVQVRALLSFLIFNSIGAPTKIVAKVGIPELLKNVVSSVEKFKLTDVELFAGKDNGTVFGEYAVVTKMKGTSASQATQ
jgi:hypothetical protein